MSSAEQDRIDKARRDGRLAGYREGFKGAIEGLSRLASSHSGGYVSTQQLALLEFEPELLMKWLGAK